MTIRRRNLPLRVFDPNLPLTTLKRRVLRQIAGATARRTGSELEAYLSQVHDAYEATERGVIMRAHPKVAGRPGFMRIIEKGGTDYVGVAHGVGVAFDAKSTDDPASFHLDPKAWRQSQLLSRWQRNGGVGFFLVYARARQIAYLVFAVDAALNGGVVLRDARGHQKGAAAFRPRVPWVTLADNLDWLAALYALGHIAPPSDFALSPTLTQMSERFRDAP